ncbi:MAG: glycogen synthase [Spirochaetia bacterium]
MRATSPLVWHVSREYAGVAEAGGVKDVVRGLAEAHARSGGSPTVVLPMYGFIPRELGAGAPVASFTLFLPDQDKGNELFEEKVSIHEARLAGVRLLLVRSPRYSALRDVYTYTAADERENHWRKRGTGHWDFHQLNLILQRAALESALVLDEIPDIFHCHDGHTAFLPALLREDPRFAGPFRGSAAVVTIHNAGKGYHQEVWDPDFATILTGLPADVLSRGLLNGTVDPFLLAGGYARLVTVSEQYARELLAESEDELAGGLGRALQERGIPLAGITNGIDPTPWDPRTPERAGIPFGFDPSNGLLEGKTRCRQALMEKFGIPADRAMQSPLYAFVGRLTGQKGIDVLFHALKRLLKGRTERRFFVVGTGEKEKESMLVSLAAEPAAAGRLVFLARFDPALASLVYASSDFFLVPSAYEPCGLTDFIAQIFGSLPIVHHVGGLVKIRDGETGFSYREQRPEELIASVERTTRIYVDQPALLDRIRRTAFEEIFSRHTWDRVLADSYFPLYAAVLADGPWTRK